jgi:hypothetical protein
MGAASAALRRASLRYGGAGSTCCGVGPPWPVSDFRLRARLDFSIPSTSPAGEAFNPAFGYGAPHPSTGGTSTLLINALLSAHQGSIGGSWPIAISGSPRRHSV